MSRRVVSVLSLIYFTLWVSGATEQCDVCVSDCTSMDDGDYRSCQGNTVYATCSNEILSDNRPCAPSGLVWNDATETCEPTSICAPCNGPQPHDVLFVIDATQRLTTAQCSFFMQYVAETAKRIKQVDARASGYPDVRISIVEARLTYASVVLHLDDWASPQSNINYAPVTSDDIDWLYNTIRNLPCNQAASGLKPAIIRARYEADLYHTVAGRDEKMVIFSNEVNANAQQIVNDFAPVLDQSNIEVIMININLFSANPTYNANNYLLGLTNNDAQRIFVVTDGVQQSQKVLTVATEICSVNPTTTTAYTPAPCGACVSDCASVTDGWYASCQANAAAYVTCVAGVLDNKQCTSPLVWDDLHKICNWDYAEACPDAAQMDYLNVKNNYDGRKSVGFEDSLFKRILLIGFISFVLINNVLICYWCIWKKTKATTYVSVDKVDEDLVDE